jgi:glycine C-acetyltransferase
VLDMLEASTALRDTLHENTRYFRGQMQANGFAVPEGDHPIVPVMLGDAVVAQKMSERLLELGIYAVGFFYPVVPQGKARIRVQISAGHTKDDLDKAVAAFATASGEIAA